METTKKGLNVNLAFTAFVVVFGNSFLFGYNFSVLNQPAALVRQFINSTYLERNENDTISESTLTVTWSLINALYIPGGILGVFLGGWLTDNVGRKRTILISQVFIFIGASLASACVAAKSPELLMVGRIVLGVHAGISSCIAPMFVTEIAPVSLRGAFGTLNQLFICIGMFIASVFGLEHLMGTEERWPFMILLEVFCAGVSVIAFIFLPDTPRYLLLIKDDRDAALKALKFYRRSDDVSEEMAELLKERHREADGASKSFEYKQLFNSSELRRPLAIACMLQLAQQFSGCSAVIFYSSSIYASANVQLEYIQYAILGTNGVMMVATLAAVPLMDKAGRRPLLIVPMVIMTVALIVMTVSRIVQTHHPSLVGLSYVTVCCVIVFIIAISIGLGPIPWMIAAELFQQGPRPKAMAVSSFVNWMSVFVIVISFESLQKFANDYTFVVFIILMILFTILTYFFVPETKNKTFDELALLFSPENKKDKKVDLLAVEPEDKKVNPDATEMEKLKSENV